MASDSSSVISHEKVQVLIEDKETLEKMVEDEEVPQEFQAKEPMELIQYIEKYVIVTLERDLCYNGFVHSIDPVSYR